MTGPGDNAKNASREGPIPFDDIYIYIYIHVFVNNIVYIKLTSDEGIYGDEFRP